jgi:large subunit ribosomal protein L18
MSNRKTPSASRRSARGRRHQRLRQRVVGSPKRPRLAVYRSLKHIYAQVIDDESGRTLVAACSKQTSGAGGDKMGQAAEVGTLIGARATELNIGAVVFDRGGNRYHGRVKALADAVRAAGVVL